MRSPSSGPTPIRCRLAAISMLYKWRGVFYDAHLVEQFIRCIGIFPVGSLVELNTGEVAW